MQYGLEYGQQDTEKDGRPNTAYRKASKQFICQKNYQGIYNEQKQS